MFGIKVVNKKKVRAERYKDSERPPSAGHTGPDGYGYGVHFCFHNKEQAIEFLERVRGNIWGLDFPVFVDPIPGWKRW